MAIWVKIFSFSRGRTAVRERGVGWDTAAAVISWPRQMPLARRIDTSAVCIYSNFLLHQGNSCPFSVIRLLPLR